MLSKAIATAVTEMQVQLPAAPKASTPEAGADVKEMVYMKILAIWKMRDSCHTLHVLICVEAEIFIREERGTKRRIKGRSCRIVLMQMSTAHSNQARDGPVCIFLV